MPCAMLGETDWSGCACGVVWFVVVRVASVMLEHCSLMQGVVRSGSTVGEDLAGLVLGAVV